MQLEQYFSIDNGQIQFTRQQASDFAKRVAGDFNPIHNVDAKRFCVPGDLLFAVLLDQCGINQHMHFAFAGMVSDGVSLNIQTQDDDHIAITDDKEKEYLTIHREGENTADKRVINELAQRYVHFSGQTFPHILVPLMEEKNVMINPARPLVIYESMTIQLDTLPQSSPELKLADAQLSVEGKRGDVTLAFTIQEDGNVIGRGQKTMVLSGLRAFDREQMDALVTNYVESKAAFESATV